MLGEKGVEFWCYPNHISGENDHTPIRGARITPDGSRYVIPHGEGVVVRDWRKGGSGLWLPPSDWSVVPGKLRALALSPDGKRIALQKGNEIRLLTW